MSTLFGKPVGQVVKHPGAATAAAKAEGLSVFAWAMKHRNDPGVTGKRARLALNFESMARRRKRG
jgi:hypothetical protein